jgi:hypothetical protein
MTPEAACEKNCPARKSDQKENRCVECGSLIVQNGRGRPRICCDACRPAKVKADREAYNAARRAAYQVAHPQVARHCEECGVQLEGQHRVTCGARRCKNARWRRRHPEAERAKQAAKYRRRRAREFEAFRAQQEQLRRKP